MALSANVERARVSEWIATLRLGGHGGYRLPYAGNCAAPVEIFCRGLPDRLLVGLGLEKEAPMVTTIETPCRKCEPCLVTRSQLWAARARDELRVASRTWFGTLTLAPTRAMQLIFAAQLGLTERGHVLDEVSDPELFQAIVKEASPDLTNWLKRVRKNSGASLRYLLVCEAHKTGLPHWHVLIHEYEGKVVKAKLEAAWRNGFSHFRLVPTTDIRTAWYVTKYLSKSALARVRASQHYGLPPVSSHAERMEYLLSSVQLSAGPSDHCSASPFSPRRNDMTEHTTTTSV